MTLYPIDAGNFKLDGGAMFGVAPKSLWQRTNPADSNNMIDIAARCLLIEQDDRLTLIDNGMGDKQGPDFFKHYYPWGGATLEGSLKRYGFCFEDITDVFLTHLHFDHCGGSVCWNNTRSGYQTQFPNARYWSNKNHWLWATQPNRREKASFLKENILPIEESGQLQFIEAPAGDFAEQTPLDFDVLFVDGHTEKQMIPHIQYNGKTLVFCADLLPTAGHIPLPFVMGYDTRPLQTLGEKEKFLNLAADRGYYLWLEHDAHNPIITVKHTEKGVRLDQVFSLDQFLN